jgi:phage replication-related protein YjqB (UPF0714/DUF867 family)
MKVLLTLVLFSAFQLCSVNSSRNVGALVTQFVTSDFLNSAASVVDPIGGVILHGVSMIISIFTESESAMFQRLLQEISLQLDEVIVRLDRIEESVRKN